MKEIHEWTWNMRPPTITDGQGIPDHINAPSEQYGGIARMIHTALAKGQHTDPDKSVLMRAGVKLDHPETYAGGSCYKFILIFNSNDCQNMILFQVNACMQPSII